VSATSTQNFAGLLTPVYSKDRKTRKDEAMPYDPDFERLLQAKAHGWRPKGGFTSESARRLSPTKARDLLSESKGKQAAHRGQVRAVKRMSGEGE